MLSVRLKMEDAKLIAEFVKTFPVLGEIHAFEFASDKSWLSPLTSRLPARFPPLYEQLILSYRWEHEVELGCLRLLPNPGTSDFAGITEVIFRDKGLVESLIPGGFIQFGKSLLPAYSQEPERDHPDPVEQAHYDPPGAVIKDRGFGGGFPKVGQDRKGPVRAAVQG